MPTVTVPVPRWARWVENFERGHGATRLRVDDGVLHGAGEDGSTFAARLPFESRFEGAPDPTAFGAAAQAPSDWGVLLVRKGGFAIARMSGPVMGESKTGQRHVQGRTKAGGQSQQRFARRRDNQARQANEAAAEHAVRIFAQGSLPLVVGGDRGAVDDVLADPRLRRMRVLQPWLPVPDPRRGVLEQAVADAQSITVGVVNA